MVDGAAKIPKNALCGGEVWLLRIVHMETNLLYSLGNIWVSEGEVLQGTNQTAVLSGVADRCTDCGGDLGMSVDGGTAWLAVGHASSLKHIQSVLPL